MYEIDSSGRSASEVFVDMRALEEGEVYSHIPLADDPAAPENTDVWAAPVLPRLGEASLAVETNLQVADVDVTELDNDEMPSEHTSPAEESVRQPLQGPPSPSSRHDEAFINSGEQRGALGHSESSAVQWLGADPQAAAATTLLDWASLGAHAAGVPSSTVLDDAPSAAPLRSMAHLQSPTRTRSGIMAPLLGSDVGALPQGAVCSSLAAIGMDEESPTHNSSADSNFAAVAADTDIGLQFSCPICLEVCEEAVETPCCHNLFCQRCLLSEEHRITDCPICKSHLQVQNVRPNVPVRRIVADLPCHCRFDGCGIKLRRRDRVRHEALCDFMPVQCRYSVDCPLLLRSEVAHHEAEVCPHRPVLCPMNCGASIAFRHLDDHLGRECPCWLCKCEYCETPICRADLDEHIQVHCQLAIVVCGLREIDTEARCEHRCERRLLEKHREDCVFKPCTCQHQGCSHITTARLLPVHEENCQWRLISCQYCGADLCMGSLQQHLQDVCPEYEMPCPFSVHGCTEKVPRRLMDMHLQQATSQHLGFVCEALRHRDMEIDSLRSEVARMRTDFNHRISNLAVFMSAPVRPPAPPPPPPPPGRSSTLNRPPSGVYAHNPVPSSLAETNPTAGGSWMLRNGHWQAVADPEIRALRSGRLPFFLRGTDQEQGQAQTGWTSPVNSMRGMGSQPQSSDQNAHLRGLRSPTRIPPPPWQTVTGTLGGTHQIHGNESPPGSTLSAQLQSDVFLLSSIADAGPDSNVPTEHAPLVQGLESAGPLPDFSRPAPPPEARVPWDVWWNAQGLPLGVEPPVATTLPPPPPSIRVSTLPPPPPPHGPQSPLLEGQIQEVD